MTTSIIEDRCPHDMLIFGGTTSCAICKRLPDIDVDDLGAIASEHEVKPRGAAFRDFRSGYSSPQTFGNCAICSEPIADPTHATWSPDLADLVGACCAD